jgi:hypothetical protein
MGKMISPRPADYYQHRTARLNKNSCELVFSADIQTLAFMIASYLNREPYELDDKHATWLDDYGLLDYLVTRRGEYTHLLIYCGKADELFDVAMKWALDKINEELEGNG